MKWHICWNARTSSPSHSTFIWYGKIVAADVKIKIYENYFNNAIGEIENADLDSCSCENSCQEAHVQFEPCLMLRWCFPFPVKYSVLRVLLSHLTDGALFKQAFFYLLQVRQLYDRYKKTCPYLYACVVLKLSNLSVKKNQKF